MTRRRGVSLIEVMVVVSTMVVVMALSGTTIFYLMRAEGVGASALTASVSFTRLQNTFRNDVRKARSARIVKVDDSEVLELQSEQSKKTQYRFNAGRVVRSEFDGDTQKSIEVFHFAKAEFQFEVSSKHGQQVATIRCQRQPLMTKQPNQELVPSHEFRIDGSVGRDQRFKKTPQPN